MRTKEWMNGAMALGTVSGLLGMIAPTAAQCPHDWTPTHKFLGTVSALATLTTSEGTFFYAGGSFTSILQTGHKNIARWDGRKWLHMGSGVAGDVRSLLTFDFGQGDAVVVGMYGSTGGVVSWDGATWSNVGTNGHKLRTLAMLVHDWDGEGPNKPELYAGGSFELASGGGLAVLNGSEWTAVGGGVSGLSPIVSALTSYQDGSSNVIIAGGQFTSAGGVAMMCVGRWDGTQWSSLGAGLGSAKAPDWGYVTSLRMFDVDGSGPQAPALFAGGTFITDGAGAALARVARWDGVHWSEVGGGIQSSISGSGVVELIPHIRDGQPCLVAVGTFDQAGDAAAHCVASWDGTRWRALAEGVSSSALPALYTAASWPGQESEDLVVGGSFYEVGAIKAQNFALWASCDTSCFADANGDAKLDINDFVHFQTQFATGNPGADCTEDGLLDIDDFVCFQTLFAIGC